MLEEPPLTGNESLSPGISDRLESADDETVLEKADVVLEIELTDGELDWEDEFDDQLDIEEAIAEDELDEEKVLYDE